MAIGDNIQVQVTRGILCPPGGVYNVVNYGAVGDGVTDDAAAIQSAIDAANIAGGGEVYSPANTYLIGTTITTSDSYAPISFTGAGAASIWKAADGVNIRCMRLQSDDVTISDMTFDGNVTGQSVWTEADYAVGLFGTDNIQVNNCRFINLEGDGLYLDNIVGGDSVTNATIFGCQFLGDHTNRQGISIVSADNVTVQACNFYRMARADMPGMLDIEPDAGKTVTNVSIVGNTFSGTSWDDGGTLRPFGRGVNISASASGSVIDGVTVTGNSFNGWFKNVVQVSGTGTEGVIITSNQMTNISSGETNSAAVYVENLSDGAISNNQIITDNATIAYRLHFGVRINSGGSATVPSMWKVANNGIKGTQLYGISCNSSGAALATLHADYNTITDCGQSSVATDGGIYALSYGGRISSNILESSVATVMETGIRIPSGVSGLIIEDNICGSLITTCYSDASSGGAIIRLSGLAYAYADLSAEASTTVTTADTYYPITGTFTNNPLVGFIFDTDHIEYTGTATRYFEIDWHASLSMDDATRVVHVGVSINSAAPIGLMGMLCKYANEPLSMSGTCVVELSTNDEIQLMVTSDTNLDVATFKHFNTTIRSIQ